MVINEEQAKIVRLIAMLYLSGMSWEEIARELDKRGIKTVTGKNRWSASTVGSILRLTEGSLCPVPCFEDEVNTCERENECVTVILWKKIDDAIKGVVDNVTLEDLVEWHNSKIDNYVI